MEISSQIRQCTLQILDHACSSDVLEDRFDILVQSIADCSCYKSASSNNDQNKGSINNSGLALSPELAASCVKDVLRSVAFIRGLYDVIQDAYEKRPQQSVQVLYAGSGPLAILAIPLMAVFSPQQVQFTILDFHRESISSVKSIIECFGFESYITAIEVADACEYSPDSEHLPDIIITETMQACLEKEPQVAISRHLLKQVPDAILIPQSVRIDASLADVAKEFDSSNNNHEDKQRISLGTVFELNADSIYSWSGITGEYLSAAEIKIPSDRNPRIEPMLFTQIQVYKDHVLNDYDSGLTVPRPFPPYTANNDGDTIIEFQYRLGSHPGLICETSQ